MRVGYIKIVTNKKEKIATMVRVGEKEIKQYS
jgi:hypothetical protein